MTDPSNIRAERVESQSKDQDDKPQRKSIRQEPRSDPTGSRVSPKDLDSLNDEQLRKLTKANTKRNHGGRSSRIRSQVERVFRRLDNLAADVKLQPRYSIDALPVVSPDDDSNVPERESLPATETKNQNTNDTNQEEKLGQVNSQHHEIETEAKSPANSVCHESEQLLEALQVENNDFEIEPATHTSGFTDSTTSINTTLGSARSVRISTSVTVLDYIPLRPVSVARMSRYEHPTRTGKCLQTRKLTAEEMDFPHFTIQRPDEVRGGGANENKENNLCRRRSVAESVNERHQKPVPLLPRRVHSTGSTNVEYVVPAQRGAYGSRVNKVCP